jgi:hypothetical protein
MKAAVVVESEEQVFADAAYGEHPQTGQIMVNPAGMPQLASTQSPPGQGGVEASGGEVNGVALGHS